LDDAYKNLDNDLFVESTDCESIQIKAMNPIWVDKDIITYN
jgi:hypothetical protein